MLVEFRVENHRSLREEQTLSMVASRTDLDDPRLVKDSGFGDPLVRAAAIYGANASGKSNVLEALVWLRDAVVESHRTWDPILGSIKRDPFALGPERAAPSSFVVTILVAGVRHEYGLVVNDDRVVEEWLFAWPKGRKQVWFERDLDDYKFGEHLRGENRVVVQVTRSDSLFLSAAAQLDHAQLAPVYAWFRAMVYDRKLAGTHDELAHALDRQLSTHPGRSPEQAGQGRQVLVDLLRSADLGIRDIRVKPTDDITRALSKSQFRLEFLHSGADDTWLSFDSESDGTRRMLFMSMLALASLRAGRLLLVDELEASLHPALACAIIQLFQDPTRNTNGAQLLFTTHDTSLLGTLHGQPPLRRDQIWLTEKDAQGATHLYPLTDFHPRKGENLERGYLQGRYGAVPVLGGFPVSFDRDGEE